METRQQRWGMTTGPSGFAVPIPSGMALDPRTLPRYSSRSWSCMELTFVWTTQISSPCRSVLEEGVASAAVIGAPFLFAATTPGSSHPKRRVRKSSYNKEKKTASRNEYQNRLCDLEQRQGFPMLRSLDPMTSAIYSAARKIKIGDASNNRESDTCERVPSKAD